MTGLDSARAVADAVLYEGYLLYPYRASAPKNRVRWQWGVLMPEDVVAADPSERSSCRTDVVVDGRPTSLTVRVRLLQVQARGVERASRAGVFEPVDELVVDGVRHTPWDEACEHELTVPVDLASADTETILEVPGGREAAEIVDRTDRVVGRVVRTRLPLRLGVRVRLARPSSPYPVLLASVRLDNRIGGPAGREAGRPDWLHRAAVACHLLLEVEGAGFVSLLDPPEWARGFVDSCVNEGLFPVLGAPAEDRGVVLSSPIILYDHPEVAPESASSFFDSLEIDELLSLRTLTLTPAEKAEARATDPRAADLLDEVEDMPEGLWERLHGTVRYLDAMTAPPAGDGPPEDPPWWDPGVDRQVDPDRDVVRVGGKDVRRGSRVVLRPGARRADAHDLFLAGRTATVAGVFTDVDGAFHLAVTLDEDPGADLQLAHGRYLYFAPDEVEPLAAREA